MSDESELADLAQRIVENLGATHVASAIGCPKAAVVKKWGERSDPVHPTYGEKLRILDRLFTRLSEETSADEARRWLTTFHPDMEYQPMAAVRYCRFMEVEEAVSRFLSSTHT